MPCERCGGAAYHYEEQDVTLCPSCFETYCDEHAEDTKLQAERDASYLEADVSPHPSEATPHTASEGLVNPPLTTLH